jgi:hypothetical protein
MALLAACSVSRDLSASLRNQVNGQVKTIHIKTEGGTMMGSLTGISSDGEQFVGTYSATVDGYQYGYDPQNSVSDFNANAQIIATGNRGTSLYCTFISSRSINSPHGNGVCQDQNRVNWNMIF